MTTYAVTRKRKNVAANRPLISDGLRATGP
jgi:hypothetical protein